MNFIVDVMGGDNAPDEIVLGCIQAMQENSDIAITAVGDEAAIKAVLKKQSFSSDKFSIVHTTEVITNEDSPVRSIRRKTDSSLVVALGLLKQKPDSVFLSAGSTGAVAAGSILILGKIEGVDRPALTTMIPTKDGYALLCDAGANTNCRPINYLQFGMMGYHYMKAVTTKENPVVKLLNIGAEEGKGTEIVKEAYTVMADSALNFKGNIEGRDLASGEADVIVCDGFSGNIALKTMEGTALYITGLLKDCLMKNIVTKIAALMLKKSIAGLKKKLDYREYGGAPLLGVNGKVIKCHGSSNAFAIKNAIIKFGVKFAQSDIIQDLKNDITAMDVVEVDV